MNMSSDVATEASLFGSVWIASAPGVNKLTINFIQPKLCTVAFGSERETVPCDYAESFAGGAHHFGLTGGSVSLLGSCAVELGTGKAQGIAAGSAIVPFFLTKIAGDI